MRKKLFKGIVTVLTAVLTAGMLTACGGKNNAGQIDSGDRDHAQVDEEQKHEAKSESVEKSYDITKTFPFYNGHAWVKYPGDDNSERYGLIDEDGNLIYTGDSICEYYSKVIIPYFQDGVTYVNYDNDTNEREEVAEHELFENGMYNVLQSKEFVIINEKGKELYRSPEGESGTYSVHQYKDRFLIGEHVTNSTEDKYVYYVIDQKGKRIFGDSVFELVPSDKVNPNRLCGVFGNKYFAVYDASENYSFFYNIEDNSRILLGDDFSFMYEGDDFVASDEYVLIDSNPDKDNIYDMVLVGEDDLANQNTFDSAKAEKLRSDAKEDFGALMENLDKLSTRGIYFSDLSGGVMSSMSIDVSAAMNLDGQVLFNLPSFETPLVYESAKLDECHYNGDHAVLFLSAKFQKYVTVIDEEGNIGYDPIALDKFIGDYNGYIFTTEGIISPTGENLSYGDKLDGIDNNTRVYSFNGDRNKHNVFLSGGFFENEYLGEHLDGPKSYMSLDGSKVIDKIFVN